MYLYINKAWGYGDPQPDHYFLALNYRMSELCGSVARAQLDKLPAVVERRRMLAEQLTDRLRGVRGIATPVVRKRRAAQLLEIHGQSCGAASGRRRGRGRENAAGARDRQRAALHRKTRVYVRGLPKTQNVRQERVSVHPRASRSARLPLRFLSGDRRGSRAPSRGSLERPLQRRRRRVYCRGTDVRPSQLSAEDVHNGCSTFCNRWSRRDRPRLRGRLRIDQERPRSPPFATRTSPSAEAYARTRRMRRIRFGADPVGRGRVRCRHRLHAAGNARGDRVPAHASRQARPVRETAGRERAGSAADARGRNAQRRHSDDGFEVSLRSGRPQSPRDRQGRH